MTVEQENKIGRKPGECLAECEAVSLKRQLVRLADEIKEARNEAATVRRAYLHERGRANTALGLLRQHDPAGASKLESQAYQGSARMAVVDTVCPECSKTYVWWAGHVCPQTNAD